MKKSPARFLLAALAGACWFAASAANASADGACAITAAGMGPVRLGMTLREARKAFPHAAFRRSTDAEGVAFVSVLSRNAALMILYANEEDADKPIDWSRKIESIETFHAACATVDGVHPGMPVKDAEQKLGKAKNIIRSEIESREYIYFPRQPENFLFRIDYTGIFAGEARATTRFSAKAKILSIAVMSR